MYGAEGNGTKSDTDIILGDALIFCSQVRGVVGQKSLLIKIVKIL